MRPKGHTNKVHSPPARAVNKFTAGNCTQFSGATGQIFAPPISGGSTRNATGVDELACIPDQGRQVFLRLTLRPTAF